MIPIVPARGACPTYRPGHAVHPTQARHLWRESAADRRHRVDQVAVEDSGLLTVTLSDGSTTHRWNHDPLALRDLLAQPREDRHAVLAEPSLLVVTGVAVSVCTLEDIVRCPTHTGIDDRREPC